MGKKAKPTAGGKKESAEVDKDDRKLQAILLADSFTKTFRYAIRNMAKRIIIFILQLITNLGQSRGKIPRFYFH